MKDNRYNDLHNSLSAKEKEVASIIVSNERLTDMAHILSIAPSTLRAHASNIYGKAKVKSRKEFIQEYSEFNDRFHLEGYNEKLARKLNKSIKLLFNENTEFENYFSNFYSVTRAMHQLDFSKRLIEPKGGKGFTNLIAQTINTVNDELELQFIGENTITNLLKILGVNDKIILLSKDLQTITHAFTNLNLLVDLKEEVVGKNLDELLTIGHRDQLSKNKIVEFESNPPFKITPFGLNDKISFSVRKFDNSILILISLNIERQFIEHANRMMGLINCIKSQYDDNPSLSNSIIGTTIVVEAQSIFQELQEYMRLKDNLGI